MNLPDDVIAIIKEYSQPLSRPGWRKLRIMPSYVFHTAILYKYNRLRKCKWCKVIYDFVRHYSRDPQDKFIYSFESYMDYNGFVSIVQLKLNRL